MQSIPLFSSKQTVKSYLFVLLRLILSAVFIFSAISKLQTIESFELFLFHHNFISLNFSMLIARIVIATELTLAIFFIINIFKKKILIFSLGLMIFFSLYLVYLLIIGDSTDNCHCMGAQLKLDPFESLLKNFVLIGLLVISFFEKKNWDFNYRKMLFIIISFVSFMAPFIISPPDMFYDNAYAISQDSNKDISIDLSQKVFSDGEYYQLKKGKKILCFYSMGCKFCRLAAKKISIINEKADQKPPILYFFYGKEEYLDEFYTESGSNRFPHIILNPKQFFSISGSKIPAILFIKDGIIIEKLNYRTLTTKKVEQFMNNKL